VRRRRAGLIGARQPAEVAVELRTRHEHDVRRHPVTVAAGLAAAPAVATGVRIEADASARRDRDQ
jgi:hypothetical protein